MHKTQKDAKRGAEVLKFFDWGYTKGGTLAKELDYAVLPDAVIEQVRSAWKTQIKDASGKPIY